MCACRESSQGDLKKKMMPVSLFGFIFMLEVVWPLAFHWR